MRFGGESEYCRDTVDNVTTVCTCCTESLAKLIRCEFRRGDTIGLTYIDQGVASIATGVFQALAGYVVVVNDLLVAGTTSFVPLCDISSVELGLPAAQVGNGMITVAPVSQ